MAEFGHVRVYPSVTPYSKQKDFLAEMNESILRDGRKDPAPDMNCFDNHAGNRSPIVDETLTWFITGITLELGKWDLAMKFLATLKELCFGALRIVKEMRKSGYDMKIVTACGGVRKSRMFLTESFTGCTGLSEILSSEEENFCFVVLYRHGQRTTWKTRTNRINRWASPRPLKRSVFSEMWYCATKIGVPTMIGSTKYIAKFLLIMINIDVSFTASPHQRI